MIIIFLSTLTLLFFLTIFFYIRYKELRWNWSEIDINKISFPKSFIWGTATASHQVEGNCKNNWSEFEKGIKSDGSPNIKDNQISGLACDHWNRYKEDIDIMVEYGEDMVQYNNYVLGTGPDLLYPVNGEACDWMFGVHDIIAYTPEIGNQNDGFWPSTTRILPLAEENLILYGSCAFKKLDLGATAVICVAELNVVVEAVISVPEFPRKVIVPPEEKFVPVITKVSFPPA